TQNVHNRANQTILRRTFLKREQGQQPHVTPTQQQEEARESDTAVISDLRADQGQSNTSEYVASAGLPPSASSERSSMSTADNHLAGGDSMTSDNNPRLPP
ncbi:hypothetical protein SARC_12696, partial [Sphaeroforma arctica JP610]